MADDDIYGNKKNYTKFKEKLEEYLKPPSTTDHRRKYWIKNKDNIKYFKQLFKLFKAKDNSYIRRLRLLRTFLMITHHFNKELNDVKEREEIDELMGFAHERNKSAKSKRDFAIDLKYLWRSLFPEKDEKGRIDETITPYVVRHISSKIDKSKEKDKRNVFNDIDEFEKLVQSFAGDIRMQALLTLSLESLGRPQEILGRRIKDVELHDNYAKVHITEHGKEGTGFLRVIDSYYYLTRWLDKHPLKNNPDAHLFVNIGNVNRLKQMSPTAANKLIRAKCAKIGINKHLTLYSLKRTGVTFMRYSGKSDADIQHTARWTTTKQLHTYDQSRNDEAFKIELIKRGKLKADKRYEEYVPKTKTCPFCNAENGFTESMCFKCNRPLDKDKIIEAEKQKDAQLDKMQKQMEDLYEVMIKQGLIKHPKA